MNRKRRRFFGSEKDDNKIIYISGIILIVSIILFIIVFVVYGQMIDSDQELARINSERIISSLNNLNENVAIEQASLSLAKNVNEVKEEMNNIINNEKNENTIVTVSIDEENKEKNNEIKEDAKQVNNKTIVNKEEINNKIEEEKEPEFIKPVDGEIIKEFAKDNLVYSETLKEWITHTGIDIKKEKTSIVKASEEGIIKSIKNDPRYGITVVIEHNKGYKTIYSNLLTAEFVKEGEKVSKGQTIGTVGDTAIFEIADEPHLHFEIIKDDEYVDPNLYLK